MSEKSINFADITRKGSRHNSIRTTEIYVHIADTFKSNIKSPLDDILEEDGL